MTRMLMASALLCGMLGAPAIAAAQALTGCPAHSDAYKIEDTASATIIHCRCVSGFGAQGGQCLPPAPPPSAPKLSCAVAQARIARDLAQIQYQRHLATQNQAQFADARALGGHAAKDMLTAAGELTLSVAAAEDGEETKAIDSLEEQTTQLEAQIPNITDKDELQTAMSNLQQLNDRLSNVQANADLKELVRNGMDARESWALGRNALHDGFTAAASVNDKIAQQLENPQFRQIVLNEEPGAEKEDENSTLWEHTADVLNSVVSETADNAKFLSHYSAITGPTITWTSFTIDAAYADLELWFAAQSADQADQNAGQLARAAGVMQDTFKHDMQARQTCTP
ncbi:hypothetical protein [Acidocella sp.]|uniref:hypothetical protein n=1 Tax=Acidocella sp. TaxID=50710 RepID=UPI0026381547|nr:hypothetical protein [Acidocella sp.]